MQNRRADQERSARHPIDPARFRPAAIATSSKTGAGTGRACASNCVWPCWPRRGEPAATWWPARPSVAAESLRLAGRVSRRAPEARRGAARRSWLAAELRVALEELGKVAGAVYTDDVLDRIFSRFCIGK